ncbi:unnamed protein product [Trichobilharzia regenti]|nr:unnamed protein product [Trichobilharzia regenti]
MLSFVPKVLYDTAPLGKNFGSVLKQPKSIYYRVRPRYVMRILLLAS